MNYDKQVVFCVIVIFSIVVSVENETVDPVVNIESGKVRGTILQSHSGKQYYAFRGIRYAKAPVDELRFQPPQPVDPWPDVLDATESHTQCPQYTFMLREVQGEEDCLLVNIYTPQIQLRNKQKRLPVLFFIHGGGFLLGTGAFMFYGASRFMDKDIVLVTFNYRIGVLGFLSTGDENLSGNYGMLDQIEALKWVQKNIAQFGGDPNRVTIFGESAGGVSVTHLMLSPLAKGLFHGAIAQSGSSLCNWSVQRNPMAWAKRIARKMECPTNNTIKMIDCFKNTSYMDLVGKTQHFQTSSMFPLFLLPVIDKNFLHESPLSLMEKGQIASKVPFIIGINKEEGYAFHNDFIRSIRSRGEKYFNGEFLTTLAKLMQIKQQKLKKIIKYIQKEYNIKDLSNETNVESGIINILSDQMFAHCVHQMADLMAKGGVPTYAYQYSFIGKHSFAEVYGGDPGKYVTHADELFIQFDFFFAQLDTIHPDDQMMSSILNTLWVNFATQKKPSFVGTPVENYIVEWESYNGTNKKFMELDLTPSTKTGMLCPKKDFWVKVVPKLLRQQREKDEL